MVAEVLALDTLLITRCASLHVCHGLECDNALQYSSSFLSDRCGNGLDKEGQNLVESLKGQ